MVQCFICFKTGIIHDDCFTKNLGEWSKYNHFFHCRKHIAPCLVCSSKHLPTSKSTSKRYVRDKIVYYMTDACATDLNTIEPHNTYTHDAFYDTWCCYTTKSSNW